jgi:EAL and modified HD-GYP domain-containing signal transduction protein
VKKFVARQPILDREKAIFAYELLFRSGVENYFHSDAPDSATSSVMVDSFLVLGMQSLTGGRKAFINVTKNVIVNQYATLLPKELAVVEVLETVEPDERVVSACEALKKKGYLIALDDFVYRTKLEPLIRLADFIKVDFQNTSEWIRRHLVQQYSPRGIRMLAERVETPEQFQEAVEMGYTYFQGFFFCKPEIMMGRDIPAFKQNYLWLLQEINKEEPDMAQLEEILKQETSLCYKFLRYLNSATFDFVGEIRSLRHALTLLGTNEVRKWVSLVALACMGEDKPKELVVSAVMRAKFCENLALNIGLKNRATELFLMGLLSMLDVILERPLAEILSEVRVSKDVKSALLSGVNLFRYVYELVLAYERGMWSRATQFAASLRTSEPLVTQAYLDAINWGHRIFRAEMVA